MSARQRTLTMYIRTFVLRGQCEIVFNYASETITSVKRRRRIVQFLLICVAGACRSVDFFINYMSLEMLRQSSHANDFRNSLLQKAENSTLKRRGNNDSDLPEKKVFLQRQLVS